MAERSSSRERVLSAFRRQPVDYVPCSPNFNPLTPVQRSGHGYHFPWGPSQLEQIEYLVLELGLDPVVHLPAGGYYPEPGVSSRVWFEQGVIHKTWSTPSGELHAAVRYDEAWPHGLDIPLNSDFNIAHYVEPWIVSQRDVECLRHILLPARSEDHLAELRFACDEARRLADRFGLATMASVGMGLTGALQLFGATELCLTTVDQPDLVDSYLELEHRKNLRDVEIALDLGADIIGRNGFYETADFYSPTMLDRFLRERLNREAEVVRQAGAVSGYTVHTGVMPILDYLDSLRFDCLMHIGISFNDVDLDRISCKLSGSKSFWVGPDNTHDMWSPDEEVVRQAVRRVFEAFGQTGLLLTACPSAHSIMPWENTLAMVDEWRRLR